MSDKGYPLERGIIRLEHELLRTDIPGSLKNDRKNAWRAVDVDGAADAALELGIDHIGTISISLGSAVVLALATMIGLATGWLVNDIAGSLRQNRAACCD